MSRGTVVDVEHRALLVGVAREAVRAGLSGDGSGLPDLRSVPAPLREPGASFVTLRRRGELLGCIGSMEPHRPLVVDVAHNAAAAAFADPRLPAVTWEDYAEMQVKVSVLGPLETLPVRSRAELAAAVEPGVDGLLVTSRRHRGTFLPSVWEQIPDRGEFLDLLWRKAGMRPGDWPADLVVHRYRTDEFGD